MALFDFLKKNEFEKIEVLTSEVDNLSKQVKALSKFKDIADIESEKNRILQTIKTNQEEALERKNRMEKDILELRNTMTDLFAQIKEKRSEIIELDNEILLQEFGFYKPIYDFANSELYKDRLGQIKDKQKQMILDKEAATCDANWSIDGSEAKGRAMTEQNIKQIIRCFNSESDILISKVKFNNIQAYIDKIRKSAEQLNRINTRNRVELSSDFVDLKIQELKLAFEYAEKKQEEKEEQKRIREQLREEAKLQKEIEEARKDIEKEQNHYNNALSKLNKQLENCSEEEKAILLEKKAEIESHLSVLDASIKDIDYREANKKAGYVYIISNIGSFGHNVYKIGMTRRLDPQERVDELGDASVPFLFDVHALIFCDDAPKLEAALHKAFETKKVNMVNNRREFFKVTLDEIEEVVKSNYDKTVEFEKIPPAEQFRESLKLQENLN